MKVSLELQPCCGERSGIGTYAYELAKRMKDGNGMEFSGNVFNFLNRNSSAASLDGICMPIHMQDCMPYGVYRRIWHWVPLTHQMMFPPADVNMFFNYIVPPRIQGKCVTTVCDMTYLRYPETMDRKNLSRIKKDISYSVERSEIIVTISEFSKREIHELLGIPGEQIRVVYCAASLPQRRSSETEACGKFGIRKPYLLYVGNMEPRKNLVSLLHAYKQLKAEMGIPHQLVCVGANGWNSEQIYREAESLRESGDVIFTGYVSAQDKSALYAHSSAFVFPSLYEGFGMPPLEAMHYGCPVVCANAASLPEIVGDAARLINPMDEADIAQGVWQVLSDTDYARALVQKGRLQAQKFSWEQSAEQLRGILEELK